MTFEEWLERESVVNDFGHIIGFSNRAVELARAAWFASREAAQQERAADGAESSDECKHGNYGACADCAIESMSPRR